MNGASESLQNHQANPAVVPWLENVPSYRPGKPADAGGLALASNEAAFCSERVLDAFKEPLNWSRYPDPLATELRKKLAKLHEVTPEQILVSNGSDELVQLLMAAYVGHGGTVVAADPPYAMSRIAALVTGANFVGVPLIQWRHDLTKMAWLRADLAYLVNPHNPTGTAHDGSGIAQFAHESNSKIVVIDEAYVDFATGVTPQIPADLVADGRTVVLRTFSKAYGLAGGRVGYLIASEEIVTQLRRVRAPFSVSAPSQAAALAALDDRDYLEAHVADVAFVREELTNKLRSLGCEVPESQANFVLAAGINETEFVGHLEQAGICVRSGASLGVPGSARITVPRKKDLPRLFAALEAALLGLGDTRMLRDEKRDPPSFTSHMPARSNR